MFDSIDKNTLKPGDVVGIKVKRRLGGDFPLSENNPSYHRAYHSRSYKVCYDEWKRVWETRFFLPYHRRNKQSDPCG